MSFCDPSQDAANAGGGVFLKDSWGGWSLC